MKQFKRILYVVEPSANQASALARAVSLAENYQADLTAMDVVPRITAGIGMPEGGPISNDLQAAMTEERQQALDAQLDPFRQRTPIQGKIVTGTPFLETIRAVLRDGYDLVVKVAEDPSFMARLFGSDDMHLLRKCPCPIWLMKPEEKPRYRRIVAALDFDQATPEGQALNRKILEMASSLALADFTELHLVNAWEAMAEEMMRVRGIATETYIKEIEQFHHNKLQNVEGSLRSWIGSDTYDYLSIKTHLYKGEAGEVIPLIATELEADLIVMGTIARTGIPGFIIGNTAETILEQIHCAVLAVKPDGFTSPVELT